MMTRRAWIGAAAIAGMLAGCGGPEASPVPGSSDRPGRMAQMHERMMGGGSPGDAPDAAAAPASAPGCPDVDQDLVERGKEIFTGAGSCIACHGGDAGGGQLGPDLTDDRWLNVDGSYESIAGVIQTGVSDPQQFPAPMPPVGGARLTQGQVCAVAAYVYSLSH